MQLLKRMCQIAFVSLLSYSAASATTVTFSGLTTDRTRFTTYSESNYTVTSLSGYWRTNTSNYGDPVPGIFSANETGSIDVTNNTSTLFTFSGVDLGNFDNDPESYTITGYLLGVEQFTDTGSLPDTGNPSTFVQYGTGNSEALSELVITLSGPSEGNLDNIVVNDYVSAAVTPEPESLTLLLTGAAGMAAVLRRRIAKGFGQ